MPLGSFAVNRGGGGGAHGALLVHGLAEHVEDAAQGGFTHGYGDRSTGVDSFHAAHQTIGAAHGHSAHPVVTQELLHFSGQSHVLAGRVFARHAEGVIDLGQLAGREFNVDHRADHLPDDAFGAGGSSSSHLWEKSLGTRSGSRPAPKRRNLTTACHPSRPVG